MALITKQGKRETPKAVCESDVTKPLKTHILYPKKISNFCEKNSKKHLHICQTSFILKKLA